MKDQAKEAANASNGLFNFGRKIVLELLTTYSATSSREKPIQTPSKNIIFHRRERAFGRGLDTAEM